MHWKVFRTRGGGLVLCAACHFSPGGRIAAPPVHQGRMVFMPLYPGQQEPPPSGWFSSGRMLLLPISPWAQPAFRFPASHTTKSTAGGILFSPVMN
jgi:hypothetical protein